MASKYINDRVHEIPGAYYDIQINRKEVNVIVSTPDLQTWAEQLLEGALKHTKPNRFAPFARKQSDTWRAGYDFAIEEMEDKIKDLIYE